MRESEHRQCFRNTTERLLFCAVCIVNIHFPSFVRCVTFLLPVRLTINLELEYSCGNEEKKWEKRKTKKQMKLNNPLPSLKYKHRVLVKTKQEWPELCLVTFMYTLHCTTKRGALLCYLFRVKINTAVRITCLACRTRHVTSRHVTSYQATSHHAKPHFQVFHKCKGVFLSRT